MDWGLCPAADIVNPRPSRSAWGLVSRKDFDRARRHHWYANRNGKRTSYAAAWIDGAQVNMHKYLRPNWAQVNHENGNGLDNRRENLRGVRGAD
jgi:hypothetical protein